MTQTQTQFSPQTQAHTGLHPRLMALHLLEQGLQRKKPLDDLLKEEKEFNAMEPRDRAFCRMLVSTILRRLRQIDTLILRAMAQGEFPRPQRLHDVLRVGCAQIFFMDVADHAAVDTSVRIAREKQRPLVNAVLRRMTGEGREWFKQTDESVNFPDWIFRQWADDYGHDTAQNIARASLSEAPLDLTVKNVDETMLWAGILGATKLPNGSLRCASSGRVTEMEGFDKGAWWVQDAASAMPATLFGDVKGKTVVDLCAAPGGKTAQLAAAGAQVIAVDRSAQRMAVLHKNLERLGLTDRVETVISDSTIWRPKEPAQFVLLDAPCTATGTIRRHPDILHFKEASDQLRLIDVQARLLRNAADIVAPGGVLIYCTCSLQKDEGERQVIAFLSDRTDFSVQPINSGELGGAKDIIDDQGFARILPFHWAARGGIDGFFIARLVRG